MNKTTYLPWLDTAKGIGIILVIIGHSMFPMQSYYKKVKCGKI